MLREIRPATPFTPLPTDTYIRRPAECVPACAAQAVRVASSLLRLRPSRQSHAAGGISPLLRENGRDPAAGTLALFVAEFWRRGLAPWFSTITKSSRSFAMSCVERGIRPFLTEK